MLSGIGLNVLTVDRLVLYQDDQFIVEEHHLEDDMVCRSLRFTSNLSQIQSQVRLKYFHVDDKKHADLPDTESLMPEKKGRRVGIDESFLCFENHR